ncbi:MAG: hypothetical protein DWP92_07130 [Armatimonadetes bacterium]|nr:MAG: hypothetical protein DWP92_07130 [Armatimonadota bacterium]
MLFWHIGASVAFVRYAFRDPFMDLRFIALGAVLSDLVDLPLAIPLWSEFESVRLVGHTTVFAVLVMVVVLVATRRGLWRKRLILLATGVLLHLALDAMWQNPETLWWPFLGLEFASSGFGTYGDYVRDLFTNPWVWAGEVAGLAYLVALWRKAGLSRPEARESFIRTGVVSAPIDRT